MLDLDLPLDEVPIALLDVETTGLSPRYGHRVCEVAILRCVGDDEVDALQRLVNPQRPMDPGAYAVHGLGDDVLREAPPFGDIAPDVAQLLQDAVVVGHNVGFDLGFMAAEFGRLGQIPSVATALDTCRLARATYRLPSYSLGRLAASLDVNVSGRAHRAMVDVLLTREVLRRITDCLWQRGVRTVNQLLAMQGGSVAVERAPMPSLPVPPDIALALREGCLLRLTYEAQDGTRTERLVRPLNVAEHQGALSLVAHCYLRNELRYFRIDQSVAWCISPTALTGETARE